MDHAKSFFSHFWHLGDVMLINLGIIGITAADIEFWMKMVSFVVGLSYTVWRWRKEFKKK